MVKKDNKKIIKDIKTLLSIAKNKDGNYTMCTNFFIKHEINLNIENVDIVDLVSELSLYCDEDGYLNYMFVLFKIENFIIKNKL